MAAPAPAPDALRSAGLGLFAAFPDELVCYLLHTLELRELLALSAASRLLRVFACEEPLWLQKHLERCARPFDYRGSWRATFFAHNPACGRPDLTAADLVPLTPVPGFTSAALYRRWYRCHVDLSAFLPGAPGGGLAAAHDGRTPAEAGEATDGAGPARIPYVPDASGMTPEEFEARFDGPQQPALLGGLAATWAGGSLEAWQPDSLVKQLGRRHFKVSKPFLTGGRTRMRLADYFAYAAQQADEEPLYIFDSSFGDAAPELLQRYQTPHIFRHDLFACLGPRREDWRWLVAGPARSGASWHVDPSATSAWNTLLAGRKRWALYPPGCVPPGVHVAIDSEGSPSFETPTSLQWFLEVFPQLPPERRPLEVLQQAGDTIFLPSGWWHCVLNLELTVAVTQNFVSPANLAAAVRWQALGAGSMFDPHLAAAYLRLRQQADQVAGGNAETAGQVEGSIAAAEEAARPAKRRRDGSAPRVGQAAPEQGGEEEGEALAAAAEHLAELDLGFSKDSLLGPWLRLMLQHEEQRGASEVWELAQVWSDAPAWRPRLATACAAAGLPPPRHRHECLPLATGWCIVFKVSGAILKFFPPATPHVTAMGCMEAAAYLGLAASGGSCSTARLLHAGLLSDDSRPAAGPQQSPMPFLVLSEAPGATLGSCRAALTDRQWLDVAAAAGCSLAALHRLPLPRALGTSCGCDGGSCAVNGAAAPQAVGGCCTAWIVRDGLVFSSALGTVDLRLKNLSAAGDARDQQPTQALQQAQQLVLRRLFPEVSAALGLRECGVELLLHGCGPVAAAAAAWPPEGACRRCTAWWPFVAFLRRQRRRAPELHRSEGSLPPQLLAQVDAFLPADPAVLVGCPCLCPDADAAPVSATAAHGAPAAAPAAQPAASSCGGAWPAWLHGDLTPGNLLLSWPEQGADQSAQQQAARPVVALIDFADGGQGDPLWDFVALTLRTLRCKEAASRACLAAYAADLALPRGAAAPQPRLPECWPRRPPGITLSYVAACYSLLHELGALHDVFKRRPALWEAASLAEVQEAAWGWLDG